MKKYIVLGLMFALLPVMQAMATSTTYYARLTAHVEGPTGSGKVYVNTSNSAGTYSDTSSSKDGDGSSTGNSADVGFYAFAQANTGYRFTGWSKTQNGTIVSSSSPYSYTISATSKTQGSPTAEDLYAHFEAMAVYTYYGRLNVRVSSACTAMGRVSASKTSSPGTYSASASANGSGDTYEGVSYNVTLHAFQQANDDYEFVGWADSDGGTVNDTNPSRTITITATSRDQSNPTTRTIWAVFKETPKPIARVRGTSYYTLEEAVTAAQNGDTIEILKSFTQSDPITIGKQVTITSASGGNYTISRGNAGVSFAVSQSVTLSNVGFDGNSIAANSALFTVPQGATLNVGDGCVIRNCINAQSQGGAIYAGGTVNVTGGEISNCAASQGGAIYLAKNGISEWYRFTFSKVDGRNGTYYLSLAELYLYDESGKRINGGTYTYDGAIGDISTLQPLHVATPSSQSMGFSNSNTPEKLFDGSSSSFMLSNSGYNNQSHSLVFRIPSGDSPVGSYSFMCAPSGGTPRYYSPTAWVVERSNDGVNWVQIDSKSGVSDPGTNNGQYSNYAVTPETLTSGVLNISGSPEIANNYGYANGAVAATLNNVAFVTDDQLNLAGDFSGSVGVHWPTSGTAEAAKGTKFGVNSAGASGYEEFFWDLDSDELVGDTEDGNLVWADKVQIPVCKIGNTEYTSLKEAVAAAHNGDTIVLLIDIEQKATLTINKNVTIDGDGHTVTRVSGVGGFVVDGNVALKDITVDGNYINAAAPMFAVSAGCSLSVPEDVTIRNCYSSSNGGAINNAGTVDLTGGTITGNKAPRGGGIYSTGTVNISGVTTVTGNVGGNIQPTAANLLKLTGEFTGAAGVAYPLPVTEGSQFGVADGYTASKSDLRHFTSDNNAEYHAVADGNSLKWTNLGPHFPDGNKTLQEVIDETSADNDPITVEIRSDANGGNVVIPAGRDIFIDLKGSTLTANITANGNITVTDSSSEKTGKLEGTITQGAGEVVLDYGVFTGTIQDDWVDPAARVIIDNYDGTRTVTEFAERSDIVECTLDTRRGVRYVDDPAEDIIPLTYASSNWVFNASTDQQKKAFVGIAMAEDPDPFAQAQWHKGMTDKVTARGDKSYDYPSGNAAITVSSQYYPVYEGPGEDSKVWQKWCWGLVEAIHSNECGVIRAWYKFPEPSFVAIQRDKTTRSIQKDDEQFPAGHTNRWDINISYAVLQNIFKWNRVEGTSDELYYIKNHLNEVQKNGLRLWENLVTGTNPDNDYLGGIEPKSAGSVSGGASVANLKATIPSANPEGTGSGSDSQYGYRVLYDLRRATNVWNLVTGTRNSSYDKTIELYPDDTDDARDPTGLYKVYTLIIPDNEQSITNEIPTKNTIGVLKVSSCLTNTMVSIPWKSLAFDPEKFVPNAVVSNLTKTTNLDIGDRIYVLNEDQNQYMAWTLNDDYEWEEMKTISVDEHGTQGMTSALSPEQRELMRGGGVWVVRDHPTRNDDGVTPKPFYVYGQFDTNSVTTTIRGKSATEPIYTMLGQPGIQPVHINNDIDWGGNPDAKDVITIPREKLAPLKLTWKSGKWGYSKNEQKNGRMVSTRVTDVSVGPGIAFWYTRRGAPFDIEWKLKWPEAAMKPSIVTPDPADK